MGGARGTQHAEHLALLSVPGLVDHGLFIGIASLALIATASGIEKLKRQP